MKKKNSNRSKALSKAWKKRRPKTRKDYLLSKIKRQANGCWIWQGCTYNGYGTAEYKFKTMPAHRMSYLEFVGPIPTGKIIRHKCDNSRCINPKHLIVGTKKDNRRDFMERNPKAQEICRKLVEDGRKAVIRFWATLEPKERIKFIKRRYAAYKKKYPKGHPMHEKRIRNMKIARGIL